MLLHYVTVIMICIINENVINSIHGMQLEVIATRHKMNTNAAIIEIDRMGIQLLYCLLITP